MQVLQTAGFVMVSKSFEHNRPQTFCRLTAEGHRRYVEYLGVLEQVVRDATIKPRATRRAVRTLASD
jgi:hypothetical protein